MYELFGPLEVEEAGAGAGTAVGAGTVAGLVLFVVVVVDVGTVVLDVGAGGVTVAGFV
jgi:hypothetical protein